MSKALIIMSRLGRIDPRAIIGMVLTAAIPAVVVLLHDAFGFDDWAIMIGTETELSVSLTPECA